MFVQALDSAPHERVYAYDRLAPVEPPTLPAPKAAPKHLDAKWVASLRVKPNVRSIFAADMFAQFDELRVCEARRDDDATAFSAFA